MCLCACLCVHARVCVFVCMSVRGREETKQCVYVFVCVSLCSCVCVCMRVRGREEESPNKAGIIGARHSPVHPHQTPEHALCWSHLLVLVLVQSIGEHFFAKEEIQTAEHKLKWMRTFVKM